jgi:DNA-binding CsgD family transcriptional regulator
MKTALSSIRIPWPELRPMRTFQTVDGPRVVLAKREREVLRLAAHGLANKEIAGMLGSSEGTVKSHLSALMRDLGLDNRTSCALWLLCHPEAIEGFAVPLEPRVPVSLGPAPVRNAPNFNFARVPRAA